MTTHGDDLDRMLLSWLDDPWTPPAPSYLGEVLERTRRTRQRPAWASLERWLPMAVITRPAAAPMPLRFAFYLLIALLAVALALGAFVVGSRLVRSTAVIPVGGEAVLVYDAYPPGDLYTVRADGTDRRQLTSGPDQESHPVWSPDGTRIAYRLFHDGADSVAVMDTAGGNRHVLATTQQDVQACGNDPIQFRDWNYEPIGLNWSPDGAAIVFAASAACDGRYDLFAVAADGSSPAVKLLAGDLQGASGAWSPDGKRLAFVGREGAGALGLYVANSDGGSSLAGALEASRLVDLEIPDFHSALPAWSPDGSEIAIANGTNGDCIAATTGTFDAIVVKADGTGQRVLANTNAKEYNPRWSPDGKRLSFQRIVDASEWVNGRPCTMATWIVEADGTNERRLEGLNGDDSQPPLWSPDGTRLVTMNVTPATGDTFRLTVISADGSEPMVTVIGEGTASWQPVAAPLLPIQQQSPSPSDG